MDLEDKTEEVSASSTMDDVLSFSEGLVDEREQQLKRPFKQHFNATVEMFGDRSTLTQIVMLLSCLRTFIQQKQPAELKLTIGKHLVSNDEFTFSVNGQEIQQLKIDSGSTFEIN